MDELDFSISMSLSLPLGRDDTSIRRYSFTISASDYSKPGTPTEIVVGRAEAAYLPIAWLSSEERFELMDECSTNVVNLEPLLFQGETLTAAAIRALRLGDEEDSASSDLIFVDSVKIDATYRGRGLGLGAFGLIPQMISPGCTEIIVAAIAAPMEAEKLSAEEFRVGKSKLRRYWGRLGLKRLGKSGYVVLHTSRKNPDPLKVSCAPKLIPPDAIDFPAKKGRKSDEEAFHR